MDQIITKETAIRCWDDLVEIGDFIWSLIDEPEVRLPDNLTLIKLGNKADEIRMLFSGIKKIVYHL